MVGQAIEVGEQLRVQRLRLVERDGRALGAPDDGAGEVQRGDGG